MKSFKKIARAMLFVAIAVLSVGCEDVFIAGITVTDKAVTWSVKAEDGSSDTVLATIDEEGLLTAEGNGRVTVIATATDASGITGAKQITTSEQIVVGDLGAGGGKIFMHNAKTYEISAELPDTYKWDAVPVAVVAFNGNTDSNGGFSDWIWSDKDTLNAA